MDMRYEFTRLLVSNFSACFLFYRDVLGLPVVAGTEDGPYAEFDLGGVSIALFDKQQMSEAVGTSDLPAAAEAQDSVCLVFAVEDVDEACRQLRGQGVDLTADPTDRPDWGIRTAHLRDPDRNLIEINQPLSPAS